MKLNAWARGCILAMPLALSLLTASPALAQGDGPLTGCLEEARGSADAFERCLLAHRVEVEEDHSLPSDWVSRLRAYVEAHPDGWDRLEGIFDRVEDRRDRKEDRLDRREDVRDRWEDRHDDQRDLEDLFDRREDRRDRIEDRLDRWENVRDRWENRWDRKD